MEEGRERKRNKMGMEVPGSAKAKEHLCGYLGSCSFLRGCLALSPPWLISLNHCHHRKAFAASHVTLHAPQAQLGHAASTFVVAPTHLPPSSRALLGFQAEGAWQREASAFSCGWHQKLHTNPNAEPALAVTQRVPSQVVLVGLWDHSWSAESPPPDLRGVKTCFSSVT